MRIFLAVPVILASIGCKSEGKQETITDPQQVAAAMPEGKAATPIGIGSQIPVEQVCMVNDAFMGKPQIPVPVNGKTYYGCCQMCVQTLNEHEAARVGIDPYSNQKVDKTEAYIVMMRMDGKVAYFESEANFLSFSQGR